MFWNKKKIEEPKIEPKGVKELIETTIKFKSGQYHSYRQDTKDSELKDNDEGILNWFYQQKNKYFKYEYSRGICIYDREDISYIKFALVEVD